MALMVRIWLDHANEGEGEEDMTSEAETGEAGDLKARAAATAVAISLRQGLLNMTTTEHRFRGKLLAGDHPINQVPSFNRKPTRPLKSK